MNDTPTKKRKKKKRQTRYAPPRRLAEPAPTEALPGSPAKIEELSRRLAAGEALQHPGDVAHDPTRRLATEQRANGAIVIVGEAPVSDAVVGDRVVVQAERTKKISLTDSNGRTKKHSLLSLLDDPATPLGQRLRAIRLGQRSSLGAISKRTSIPKSTLSRIERGERVDVSVWLIVALARAYRTTVDELLGLRKTVDR